MTRLLLSFALIILLLAGCNVPTLTETEVTATLPAPPDTPAAIPTETQPAPTDTAQAEATSPPATDAPPVEPQAETGSKWIAFIGQDGNLWLQDPSSGELKQVTQESVSLLPAGDSEAVAFSNPQWSSDGKLLAYQREHRTPVETGMNFQYSLWVYDVAGGESREVPGVAQTVGFAWRPGTHTIAFGLPVDDGYFTTRGNVDSSLAHGLQAVDVDTNSIFELVAPARGFSLRAPRFSPDGKKVGFEEINYMEGSGFFAYVDLTTNEYYSWEKPLGGVAWSPDGEMLAYDYLTYAPTGTERIHLNDPRNGSERVLSPEIVMGYAFSPRFSPQGDRVAYITEEFSETSSHYKILLQGLNDSLPRELGLFDQPGYLSWSPDGQSLLLTVGEYGKGQLILVNVSDGSVKPLAAGVQPVWQP